MAEFNPEPGSPVYHDAHWYSAGGGLPITPMADDVTGVKKFKAFLGEDSYDFYLALSNPADVASFFKHMIDEVKGEVEREVPAKQLATIRSYRSALRSAFVDSSGEEPVHLEAEDSVAVQEFRKLEDYVRENVDNKIEEAKRAFETLLDMPSDLAKDVARIPLSRKALMEIMDEEGFQGPREKVLELGNAFKRPSTADLPPLPASTRKKLGLMILNEGLPGACAWEAEWYFQSLSNSDVPDPDIVQSRKVLEAIAKAAASATHKAKEREISRQSEVIRQKNEEMQRLRAQLEDVTSRMLANMRI